MPRKPVFNIEDWMKNISKFFMCFSMCNWSQPNHSLTVALEAPATWDPLPYTKINKTCKFWID
eukprot:jgi/Psemu1/61392/gm1.61392_g